MNELLRDGANLESYKIIIKKNPSKGLTYVST